MATTSVVQPRQTNSQLHPHANMMADKFNEHFVDIASKFNTTMTTPSHLIQSPHDHVLLSTSSLYPVHQDVAAPSHLIQSPHDHVLLSTSSLYPVHQDVAAPSHLTFMLYDQNTKYLLVKFLFFCSVYNITLFFKNVSSNRGQIIREKH